MSEVATPDAGREGRQLSAAQRSLWSSQRRYPDAPLQNMALMTHIDGPVDVPRLVTSFDAVVAASKTLRLTISPTVDGESDVIDVRAEPPRPTEVIDLQRSAAPTWAEARIAAPIDTSRSVYDSVVLRHDDGTISWYLALHHVATDATSSALVYEATVAAYQGRAVDLIDVARIEPHPQTKRTDRAARFWADREAAPLVDSLYRPVTDRTPGARRIPVDLGPLDDVRSALDGPYAMISEDLAWTAFLMTALAELIHRTSGAERFAIGLPIHHRSSPDSQRAIGPLMEVHPVDVEVEPGATHASLHRSISKTMLKVIGHAHPGVGAGAADVSGIVNVIPRGGIGSFGSWSTTTNWIHPGAADPYHLAGLQLTTYASGEPALSLDLNEAVASERQRQRAGAHVRSIIEAMVAEPDEPIDRLPLATRAELDELRVWGTGTALADNRFRFDPSKPRTTGSVLDRLSVALRNSTRPAVVDGERVLTGQELWAEASRVAASLADVGVGRGQRVGVEFIRSADAVAAIIGVLLTGASYVPLDPNHPEHRRIRIGERAGVVGVLTDLDGLQTGAVATALPAPALDPDDEAYVLFTSGSTGEPKGVPITHAGLADYLAFAAEHYLGPKQRRPVAPLFTSLGFDLTVTSLFLPLIGGGSLVIVADDGVPGLRALARRPELTWIKATPSHLELLERLLPTSHGISTMVVGGEAFPARLAAELAAGRPSLDIFNEYGPTEAVVGCMVRRWSANDRGSDVPIGRPAPGVALRVVDPSGGDTPIGVAGELLISSPGLSPGYLGEDADTGPFRVEGGRRWYASGDIVRLLERPGGDLDAVFLGRIDDQIKLNGVRLEPAEVAAAIESHPGVRRAVVRLWTPPGVDSPRPLLAAWVAADAGLSASDLRVHLLPRVAAHQVPALYAIVDELTFNANGKLDAAALPAPGRVKRKGDQAVEAGEKATASTIGATVLDSWQEALSFTAEDQPITDDDDFFELGGDSLAALEMTARVSDTLDVEVPEGLVFSAPTFADFVAVVDRLIAEQGAGSGDTESRVGPVRSAGPVDPSPGEAALLFEHRLDPASPRYNIGRSYRIDGDIDPQRLRTAAEAVVARHEPLHTTHGPNRRRLPASQALHFSIAELEGVAVLTADVSRAAARALYEAPFDLDDGPLVRIALHRLDNGGSAVVVVMHHISGDAGSLDRFWNDLSRAYDGEVLEPLPVSYGDHAAWQRKRDRGADFWRELWTTPVVTDLGLLPPLVGASDGYLECPASFSASALRAGPGRTPTATALAGLAVVLDRYHAPADDERPGRYGIGLTASTREHPSSEPMVGYFLNTLPMVVEVPAGTTSVADLATSVSALLGDALPHRSHPFAEMVAAARRTRAQLPVPEVLLAVEDLAPAELGGRPVEHEIMASGQAIAAATVFVQIRGDRVDLGIEYRGSALDGERARLLLADLDAVLTAALDAGSDLDSLPSVCQSVLRGAIAPSDDPLTIDIGQWLADRSDRPAVRCGDDHLSWGELSHRSAHVAELLRLNGVGSGDTVVLSLSRSVDLVVGLVAILRIGAVYVPIDPTYPAERRALILDAAAPAAAIVEPGEELAWLSCVTIPAAGVDAPSTLGDDFTGTVVSPDDLAYVIFTSGSTGTPKGVPITHGQLASSTRARASVYSQAPERFLLLSSIGFDSSIVGLFWTLAAGGELIIPTEEQAHDPDALLALMDRAAVTHVLMVPTLYRALVTRGADLEHWPATVTVAGEACNADLVARHHDVRPTSALFNEYGPTEATVWTTVHRCVVGESPVPIGRPIDGVWCAVVDGNGDVVPFGAVGELVIGGSGVARGYVGPGRAIDDGPFADESPLGPGRTYRTGDAVAATAGADGSTVLVFVGRVDDQLNVGGVRLEPGEVERVLLGVEGVDAVAVVAGALPGDDGGPGRELLVAHLQSRDEIDLGRLRSVVNGTLPSAARPSRYLRHDALPTTVHGKIDRAALAALPLEDEGPSSVADHEEANEVERAVLALFAKHLDNAGGLDQDFFSAGGDSLAALTLAMDLEETFGTDFSVTSLLAEPSARAVARHFTLPGDAGGALPTQPDSTPSTTGDPEATAPGGSLIEWVRAGDPELPVLVLLAPGSGHLLGYQPLIAALSPSVPVLGVRQPGYDGKSPPIDRVDALADAVGPDLAAALGDRPAMVLGGSSGGLLAWELQHRAEATGRSFAGVILQDTVHPDWRRERNQVGTIEELRRQWNDEGPRSVAVELFGRGQRRYARWRRHRASRALQATEGVEMPEVIAQRMFAAANRMLAHYRPPTIDADVVFLAASNTDPDATFERWREQTTSLRVEVFDGDHFGENGITAARNVGPVAAMLEAHLRSNGAGG